MNVQFVLPSIWPPYLKECLATMAPEVRKNTLVIENTLDRNTGIAGAWNRGRKAALLREADWLIAMSSTVRFGAAGGMDLVEELTSLKNVWAAEAARMDGMKLSFHLVAFPARTLIEVGAFDANFWPRDWDDLDYSYRIQLAAGLQEVPTVPIWPTIPIDVDRETVAHSIHLAKVEGTPEALHKYYRAKWGGSTNEEKFRTPFDSGEPISWWPQPPDRRAVFHKGWNQQ